MNGGNPRPRAKPILLEYFAEAIMADESLMKSAIFIAVACTSAREWYGEVRQKLRNRASSEEYNIGLACGRGLLPYISGLLEPLSCPTKLASGGLLVEAR